MKESAKVVLGEQFLHFQMMLQQDFIASLYKVELMPKGKIKKLAVLKKKKKKN